MLSAFLVVQVILGIALVVLILLQQGKGADMGAAFGSGSSGTVFGSQGAGNFMTRTTAIIATLFIVNSLVLSTNWILGDREPSSVTEIPGSVVSEPAVADVPEVPLGATDEVSDLPASAPADLSYRSRRKLYQLYHILNHAVLFGGHYLQAAQDDIVQLNQQLL